MLIAVFLSFALAAPTPAENIAKQPRVELGSVSIDGHLGATSVELARITGDDALPTFLEMARSSSAVARVAAAAALVNRTEPEARAAIIELTNDKAVVKVQYGCLGTQTTVAAAVQHIVKHGVI